MTIILGKIFLTSFVLTIVTYLYGVFQKKVHGRVSDNVVVLVMGFIVIDLVTFVLSMLLKIWS